VSSRTPALLRRAFGLVTNPPVLIPEHDVPHGGCAGHTRGGDIGRFVGVDEHSHLRSIAHELRRPSLRSIDSHTEPRARSRSSAIHRRHGCHEALADVQQFQAGVASQFASVDQCSLRINRGPSRNSRRSRRSAVREALDSHRGSGRSIRRRGAALFGARKASGTVGGVALVRED